MYKLSILSRHPSHKVLRRNLPKSPVRAVVRLGSTTEFNDGIKRIEINSANAVRISANKRLMKEKFDLAKCPTAPWVTANNLSDLKSKIKNEEIRFPIVAKCVYGSRGKGNTLLDSIEDLNKWAGNREFNRYIFENYMGYLFEYRLHVTKHGCFYACRKALIKTTKKSERWHRHIDNSVWLLESNPDFLRPNSWDDIVSSCVAALKAIGADILSFDVRVQSPIDSEKRKRKYQNFILIECNSASSMKSPSNQAISVCASKYLNIIPKLIAEKAKI